MKRYKQYGSEHVSYKAMIDRCHKRPLTKQGYGINGVVVCEEWRNSFDAFLRDMGEKPTPKHTIDRIDNSKGYFKENCRWATSDEQNRNKRSNIFIEFDGRRMCITDWAKSLGIQRTSLEGRFERGWTMEAALTTPAIRIIAKSKEEINLKKRLERQLKDPNYSYKRRKAVIQMKDGVEVARFDSVYAASKATGLSRPTVADCASGKVKYPREFQFKFLEK